jgi:hypothetical protein
MAEWYSIEVFDGATSAALWSEAHGDPLLESALSAGARDWCWHRHSWGTVLELKFEDARSWEFWRSLAQVQAALDSVPDPVSGLIIYRGRGGSSGSSRPRRPRPLLGSGSAALPLPWEWGNEGPARLPGITAAFLAASPSPVGGRRGLLCA